MDWKEINRRHTVIRPKILADLAKGMSAIEVANKYGISRARVYQIRDKYGVAGQSRLLKSGHSKQLKKGQIEVNCR